MIFNYLQSQLKEIEKKMKLTDKLNKELSKVKCAKITSAEPKGVAKWSSYNGEDAK